MWPVFLEQRGTRIPMEMATAIRLIHKMRAALLRDMLPTAPIAMIRIMRSTRALQKHAMGLTTTATRT